MSKKKNRTRQTRPASPTRQRAIEAGASLPDDMAAAAEATGTSISFRWRQWDIEVEPERLDDFEAVYAMENGQPGRMLNTIVSDDETRNEIIESLRGGDGRVRLSSMLSAVYEMLERIGQGN